jgi:DNA-binding transcriptional MerR regulator
MWISELSDRTRVPIDTIKHYLRIGVLPRGRPIADRRSEYDESHVERLRLIRAMIEIGGMRLDSVRRVFDSVDESQTSLRDALGQAHYELSRRFLEDHEPTPGWRIRSRPSRSPTSTRAAAATRRSGVLRSVRRSTSH